MIGRVDRKLGISLAASKRRRSNVLAWIFSYENAEAATFSPPKGGMDERNRGSGVHDVMPLVVIMGMVSPVDLADSTPSVVHSMRLLVILWAHPVPGQVDGSVVV